MRKNHSKIVCIKLVHLPYLYIWCTVTLISNYINMYFMSLSPSLNHKVCHFCFSYVYLRHSKCFILFFTILVYQSADFSSWFRLKNKKPTTFDAISSTKSMFFKFRISGGLQTARPPMDASFAWRDWGKSWNYSFKEI